MNFFVIQVGAPVGGPDVSFGFDTLEEADDYLRRKLPYSLRRLKVVSAGHRQWLLSGGSAEVGDMELDCAREKAAGPRTPVIASVVIDPMPVGICDTDASQMPTMPKVTATFDNGTTEVLFEFYADELSFTEDEFIGLTLQEGIDLHATKDVAYLRGE